MQLHTYLMHRNATRLQGSLIEVTHEVDATLLEGILRRSYAAAMHIVDACGCHATGYLRVHFINYTRSY